MKKKSILMAIIVVLIIASIITKHFFPEPGIDYLYFVPVLFCFMILMRTGVLLNIYKRVLIATIGCVIWVFVSELFIMELVLPKLLWALIGAVSTFIGVIIYNKKTKV